MPGPMLITDLLRDAADALEEAYRGRDDVPPAALALVVALRERVEHITAGKPVMDEPDRPRQLLPKTNRRPGHILRLSLRQAALFAAARDGTVEMRGRFARVFRNGANPMQHRSKDRCAPETLRLLAVITSMAVFAAGLSTRAISFREPQKTAPTAVPI
jgi:hypothetical protein